VKLVTSLLTKAKALLTNLFRFRNESNNKTDKLDQKLVFNLNKKGIPSYSQFKTLPKFLSKKERAIFKYLTITIAICIILLGGDFYFRHTSIVPDIGGSYTEGLVGVPQYINPVLASYNDVDRDISSLIFNGLLKVNSEGVLEPDLAESYQISPDRLIYTFKTKEGITWHDGKPFSVDDIIFTVNAIQDPEWQSQIKSALGNVQIEKLDETNLRFILKDPVTNFLNSLTFGILPKSLWEEINPENISLAEYNIKPIGSGPYKFDTLIKDKTGLLHNYNLISNPDYYLTKPFIDKFVFKFFASPEELISGLNNGLIDGGNNLNNDNLKNITSQSSYSFQKLKTPSNTALFFNLRSQDSIVYNYNIRKALALAINKPEIIKNILRDNAIVLNSPLNPVSFGFSTDTINYEYNLTEAKKLLETEKFILSATTTNGQIKNTLTKNGKTVNLKLTVINDLEQIKIAEAISATWQDLGFIIDLDIIEKNDFINKTLKPKDFQIVLFSWSAGVNPDPYQMWHSSQSTEKGFNLSGFSDKKIDKLLEDSRINNNLKIRQQNLNDFQKELTTKLPAIFLYSPYQIYIQNKRLKGFNETIITSAEDRFNNITTWYLKESKALK